MEKIINLVLNTLFPPTHIENLLNKITFNEILIKCKLSDDDIGEDMHAVFCYKDPFIKDAVIELKMRKNPGVIELFGRILHDEIRKELNIRNYELREKVVLSYIPQHISKLKDKGFNQTEELVNKIIIDDKRENALFEIINCLKKVKDTKPQKEIKNRRERFLNIRGAFKTLNEEKIKDRVIVLIDDVCTTGGTFKEARQMLLASGASQVLCFAIAH